MQNSVFSKRIFWKSLIPILLANFGRKTPLNVTHMINFACNLRCKYCGLPEVKIRELKTDQIKEAIEDFSKAGTVSWSFTGGEPLLRKDLGPLADFTKECGINSVELNTNGLLYKYRRNELDSVDKIFISLDGPREIHEAMRGIGTYDKVVEAIDLTKDDGKQVSVISVLSEQNMKNDFEGLRKLFDFSIENEVKISFNVIYTHDFNKDFIQKYETEIGKNIQALKLIIDFDKKTELLDRSSSLYIEAIKQLEGKKTKVKSFAGVLYCRLLPNGIVAPCLFNLNEGINGTRFGFVKAFKMLNKKHTCNSNYSHDTNNDLLYSLNLNSIFKLISK